MTVSDESGSISVSLEDLDDLLLPEASSLVARHGNVLRPTAIARGGSLLGIDGVGIVASDGRLLGIACAQDLGVRVILSELFVAAQIRRQGFGRQLVTRLLRKFESGYRSRILACAKSEDSLCFLAQLGFEKQAGEIYLRKDLLSTIPQDPEQAARSLPAALKLECDSRPLLCEAVRLWRQETEMHMPDWEDPVRVSRSPGARVFAVAVRDAERKSLVGAVLASGRGLDSMLCHLYVSPEWRRRKVATTLVDVATALLRRDGCASTLVCVHTSAAERFWSCAGFVPAPSAVLLQLDVGVGRPQ